MVLERNEEGTITTQWYKKSTTSGRIISWTCNHTMKHKLATAKNMIRISEELTDDVRRSKKTN